MSLCFICHPSPTLTHFSSPSPPPPTCSHCLPSFPYLSPPSPPWLMCLFDFAESCVMTKTSLPGCMRSVPVSCPSEAWGPSRAHSTQHWPLLPMVGGGTMGGWRGRVIAAQTLSCLLMRDLHICRKTHKKGLISAFSHTVISKF